MAKTETLTQRKRVLHDVTVTADLSGMIWPDFSTTNEEWALRLEKAVKEFDEFLRDHRSQDKIQLDVNREYQYICTACGEIWESMPENEDGTGHTCCANCGAIETE